MSIICLIFYKGIQCVALLYDECKGNYFIIIVFTVEDIYTIGLLSAEVSGGNDSDSWREGPPEIPKGLYLRKIQRAQTS